jgi:hypothetical protein
MAHPTHVAEANLSRAMPQLDSSTQVDSGVPYIFSGVPSTHSDDVWPLLGYTRVCFEGTMPFLNISRFSL